jgi:hypothetical protein
MAMCRQERSQCLLPTNEGTGEVHRYTMYVHYSWFPPQQAALTHRQPWPGALGPPSPPRRCPALIGSRYPHTCQRINRIHASTVDSLIVRRHLHYPAPESQRPVCPCNPYYNILQPIAPPMCPANIQNLAPGWPSHRRGTHCPHSQAIFRLFTI